ncbi:MAG TPA: S8 family serine peptidase [Pyrinomonadaceae bacterium]|jgi:subtilisin family serine protease|nr:S8 family serine peptidase [Pyrinomonadaceae bacterium]
MKNSPAPRELILVTKPNNALRATEKGLVAVSAASPNSLQKLLAANGASVQPVFDLSEDLLEHRISMVAAAPPQPPLQNLSRFYRVSARDSRLKTLAKKLRADPNVERAYIKPGVELPLLDNGTTLPAAALLPPVTPSLLQHQVYLGPSPRGVNAKAAWEIPGGDGRGVRIIDVEGAWLFSHEDLRQNQGGVVGGQEHPDLFWRNHGTAVLGVFSGDRSNTSGTDVGITGICPEANVRAVSVFRKSGQDLNNLSGVAAAIRQAADFLDSGDIMVVELQAPGPPNFEVREDQQGYVPIEWWPDNFKAIDYAVKKGVIVVAAAGNGGLNLNDEIYDENPKPDFGPFPEDWSNPFRRRKVDSGSILVGAGAPPLGFNHSDLGPDRSRLSQSNFWTSTNPEDVDLIDAQGWGAEVTTCGYGNLQKGKDEVRWYRIDFNGTSSATPMVAGALACVQGILKKKKKPLLTPAAARALLRATGSPQQDAPDRPVTQKIGNRPDIMAMITHLGLV